MSTVERVFRGSRISATRMNLLAEALERNSPGLSFTGGGVNSFTGGFHARRRTPILSSGDLDPSDFAFGYSISGTTVTIMAGDVYRGTRAAYEVAETNVTITADHQYVPLYVYLTLTEAWAEVFSPTVVKPQPSTGIWAIWLHKFRLQNGVVSRERIGHLGNLYLPGVAA